MSRLLLLFVWALCAGLFLFNWQAAPVIYSDSNEYLRMAQAMASGHPPVIVNRPPVYPATIVPFAWAGRGSAIVYAQIAVGALLMPLLYVLAHALTGQKRASFAFAMLAGLNYSVRNYEAAVLTETLSATALAAYLWLRFNTLSAVVSPGRLVVLVSAGLTLIFIRPIFVGLPIGVAILQALISPRNRRMFLLEISGVLLGLLCYSGLNYRQNGYAGLSENGDMNVFGKILQYEFLFDDRPSSNPDVIAAREFAHAHPDNNPNTFLRAYRAGHVLDRAGLNALNVAIIAPRLPRYLYMSLREMPRIVMAQGSLYVKPAPRLTVWPLNRMVDGFRRINALNAIAFIGWCVWLYRRWIGHHRDAGLIVLLLATIAYQCAMMALLGFTETERLRLPVEPLFNLMIIVPIIIAGAWSWRRWVSRPFLQRTAGIVLILLGIGRGTASAQYKIDSWTTEQGLPQASVGQVNQTRDGFLWFSTFGGLVRFDGINFRVFDTVSNPELPSSRLGAVLVDAEGLLWVATQSREVMLFDGAKFRVMGAGDGLTEKGFANFFLYRGRALVRTVAGDFIWKEDRFVPDVHKAPPGFAGRLIVGSSAAGALWYLDAAGLAHRYEDDRHTRTVRLPPTRGPIFVEDSAGRLWMREVQTGYLICITGDTVHTFTPKDGVIPIDSIWMMEDPDGTLWFAEIAGVLRYRDGRFTSYTKADGLPVNHTNSIFRDREGTHWMATQGGLARFTEQPIASYAAANGLAANNTYPILQDRRGDIWIGGWPGLTRYRNGVFEDMTRTYGLGSPNVLSLLEDRDGALWLGSWGGGVWRINIAGDGRAHYFPGPVAPDVTFAIYQGRGADLWFGSERGAVRYRDGVFEPPVPAGAINTFFEDASGSLWMGTEAGLARYANGVITQFGEREGFSGRRVRVIHPDANGALWIGTYDTGLFRYRNGTFTRYTTAEGLPTNGAFQILEDNDARFWICSNVGIYRVAKSELNDVAESRRRTITAVRYGRDDGMANQECNGLGRPAGIRATDGRFWFPTQGGVAVVHPAAVGSHGAPPVLILNAEVGGFPVPSLDRIEIRSGSTSFQAHYTALTFVRPELAQFKYKMEGLDPDWIDAGTDRTARYARLPFGDFRFRVIAANRDGIWNEEGASIPVSVIPPFWKTTWFMWLMIGTVTAAGFATHRVRLGVIEGKRLVQQAFARQLIDSQETDRKRIASELHDGVSQTLVVIRNWSRMSEQPLSEDVARKKLGDISSAASQALGEVREVVQDLVPYHLERVGLADAMREAAARVADSSGIAITCTCADLDGALSTAMSLRLFRVAQEGLNNVVKHSGATSASIDVSLEPGLVRLAIHDNGKGFVPEAVKPTAAGDGFGLVGMAERARMMGGDITIDSAPGKGTTITIVVPTAGV